jgi:hypothetical protein
MDLGMTIALDATPAVTDRQLLASFARAEWIKLRTVRSTTYSLVVAAVISLGVSALACQRLVAELGGAGAQQRFDLLHGEDFASRALIGNAIAQLAIGALGVLVVTSEFGTGMVRASLCAMPQRVRWIAAKLAVFGVVALVVGQVLTLSSFSLGQAILSIQHVGLSLSDPGALRAVIATGLYLALIGLAGAAFGLIVRHTAGALVSLIGMLFILPAVTNAFSEPLQGQIMRFLPENIGEQSATITRLPDHFAPWAGIGLMAAYVAVLLTIGCVLLQRRDV